MAQKWEYYIHWMPEALCKVTDTCFYEFSELGREGWELVTSEHFGENKADPERFSISLSDLRKINYETNTTFIINTCSGWLR